MTNRYELSPEAYEAAFAAFKAAIARAPGQTAFANMCRCTQGNISQLLRNGSLLPERFVLKAEAGTGVPRTDLRPDIYPADDDTSGFVGDSGATVACDRGALLNRAAGA